jgi:hypothetical protein
VYEYDDKDGTRLEKFGCKPLIRSIRYLTQELKTLLSYSTIGRMYAVNALCIISQLREVEPLKKMLIRGRALRTMLLICA